MSFSLMNFRDTFWCSSVAACVSAWCVLYLIRISRYHLYFKKSIYSPPLTYWNLSVSKIHFRPWTPINAHHLPINVNNETFHLTSHTRRDMAITYLLTAGIYLFDEMFYTLHNQLIWVWHIHLKVRLAVTRNTICVKESIWTDVFQHVKCNIMQFGIVDVFSTPVKLFAICWMQWYSNICSQPKPSLLDVIEHVAWRPFLGLPSCPAIFVKSIEPPWR